MMHLVFAVHLSGCSARNKKQCGSDKQKGNDFCVFSGHIQIDFCKNNKLAPKFFDFNYNSKL